MDEKQLLVEKYGLKHENCAWYSEKENAHKHLIFKDAFFERTDIIGLLFRINKLCMAKVKYFRANIAQYDPLKYDYKKGFVNCAAVGCGLSKTSQFGVDFRFSLFTDNYCV